MHIIRLGAQLEEISKNQIREKVVPVRDTNADKNLQFEESDADADTEETEDMDDLPEPVYKQRPVVIFCNQTEANEALKLTNMSYDGDTDVSKVEFCKVEAHQDCLEGSLSIPKLSDVNADPIQIIFFINQKNIVIIDNSKLSETILMRIRASRTKQGSTRERFLYNYFCQFLSQDLYFLDRYEKSIMEMEERVASGDIEDFQDFMFPTRRELITLREYYDELKDMGKELEENENRIFNKKNLKYFGIITDRADRLMGRTEHLIDYIGQVKDAYQEQIAEQQNKNMQFLTIISTIFMPLTLITGWYGMNFKNMPELENGYPYVIGIMLVVIIIVIIIFKKRKIF